MITLCVPLWSCSYVRSVHSDGVPLVPLWLLIAFSYKAFVADWDIKFYTCLPSHYLLSTRRPTYSELQYSVAEWGRTQCLSQKRTLKESHKMKDITAAAASVVNYCHYVHSFCWHTLALYIMSTLRSCLLMWSMSHILTIHQNELVLHNLMPCQKCSLLLPLCTALFKPVIASVLCTYGVIQKWHRK